MTLRDSLYFPTDTEYRERYGGQEFDIVRPLTEDEADLFDVGPMYKVKTASGDLIDVFEDEVYEYIGGDDE